MSLKDVKKTTVEEVFTLPNGHTLLREENGVGGHRYWSAEVGGGVVVWDTSLVDTDTLLAAILAERARERQEKVAARSASQPSRPFDPKSVETATEVLRNEVWLPRDRLDHYNPIVIAQRTKRLGAGQGFWRTVEAIRRVHGHTIAVYLVRYRDPDTGAARELTDAEIRTWWRTVASSYEVFNQLAACKLHD